ncbi:hypothetical protein NBRC3222_2686 [Acetobacter pasteurianus NBRC 3222]|nr:hypothetical protein NBRC3222_2686 [Acetobacter pasteurianus NBRC 3222]
MTEIRYFLMLYVRSVRLIWRQITIFQKGSNSSDKDGEFSRCLRYKNIFDTNKKIGKAKDILNKNGIFFSEDLYNEFLRLINIIHGAWAEQRSIFNSPNFRFETPNTQNLVRNGEKLIDTIRKILRTNLHIRPVDFTNRSQRGGFEKLSGFRSLSVIPSFV